MDSSTVQYVRCFDRNNLIKFLRDQNYIDVAAVLKQKDIDGRRFLELTELDLIQWRVSPKQKKMILNCRDQIVNKHHEKNKEKPTVPKKPAHVTSRLNSRAKIFQELENKLNTKQTEEIPRSIPCSPLDEYVDMTSKSVQTQQQSQQTYPKSVGIPGHKSLQKVPTQNINKQTTADFRNKSVVPEKPAKNTNKAIRPLPKAPSQLLLNHINKQDKPKPLNSTGKCVNTEDVNDELYEEPNPAINSNTFSSNGTRRLPEVNQRSFGDNDEGYVTVKLNMAQECRSLPPKPFPMSHQGGVISKNKKETSHNLARNVSMRPPNLSVAKELKTYSESIYEDEPKLVASKQYKIPPRPTEVSHDTGWMRQPSLSLAKELNTYSESIYEDEPKLVPPTQEFHNHKYKIPPRPTEASHDTGWMPQPSLSVAKELNSYSESIYEDEPKHVPPKQEFHNHKYKIPPRPIEVSHDTGWMRQPSLSVSKELNTYSESIYEDEPKLVKPPQEFHNRKYTPDTPPCPTAVSHDTVSMCPSNLSTTKELNAYSESIYEEEPKLVPSVQKFQNNKFKSDIPPRPSEVDTGSIKPRASNESDWAKRQLPLPPNIQTAASPFAEQNALPKPPQFQKKFEKSQLSLVKNLMEEEEPSDSKKEFNPNDCQFYRNTDRKGARQLLLKIPNLADGAFVLRKSDGYFLALTIYYQNHFYNVGIHRHEDGSFYCKTENDGHVLLFKTLEGFIEYYKIYPITLKTKEALINICLKELLTLDIY